MGGGGEEWEDEGEGEGECESIFRDELGIVKLC